MTAAQRQARKDFRGISAREYALLKARREAREARRATGASLTESLFQASGGRRERLSYALSLLARGATEARVLRAAGGRLS